jgi:hypothetical protein
MTIQIVQGLKSVRFPKDNVSLFSTTGDLLLLNRVDKTVDTFLMQVKGLSGTVLERLKLVHVNETVQTR